MKLRRTAAATAFYVVSLFLTYYAHIAFLKVNVVFYAAITDGVVAALISGVVLFTARYFVSLSAFEKGQLVVIWLLAGYAFAISVPTVIDRSLSFYILEKLQQRGGGIKVNSFETVFTTEYVKEHRLVDVRLTEQMESGTVTIADGCVRLTVKGNVIATVGRIFRRHFLPKKRLLMGEYSSDLTDPFKNSASDPGYQCR